MKAFIFTLIVLVCSCNFSIANNTEPNITSLEGKILVVDLIDYNSNIIEIDIFDNDGYKLHSEDVNTNNYKQRKYNLKHLPTGIYFINITTAQRIISKKIDLNHSQILIHEDDISFKPYITKEENKWKLNFLAQQKETYIIIYNEDQTLFSEIFKDQMGVFRSYDLKNLKKGKYFLQIEVDGNTFTDTFIKS